MTYLVVNTSVPDLGDEDVVGRPGDANSLGGDLAEDADRDAGAVFTHFHRISQISKYSNNDRIERAYQVARHGRDGRGTDLVCEDERVKGGGWSQKDIPREGMAHDQIPVDAELLSKLADLVLEHLSQGLDELEL